MLMNKKAVILLSGGLDSATILALAIHEGYDVYAITFNYGQRHKYELKASKRICREMKVNKHLIYKINLRQFGGSALTDNIPVPKNRMNKHSTKSKIPITYVPARNTIFLSLTLAWAEVLKIHDIFIGVNAIDYSGYPDCRPEYIRCFQKLSNLATKEGIEGTSFKIHTPLINLNKAQIIQKGLKLGVDYGKTSSCYSPTPNGIACGKCDSCSLRLKGFKEAKSCDPVKYL